MGNSCAVRILGDFIRSHKPDFLFLSETLVTSNKIATLCSKFHFHNSFAVDCNGRSGGLAIFWKRSFNCNVQDYSSNHINVQVNWCNNVNWRLTCFYGFPERSRRHESWEFIKFLAAQSSLPWCILGDFNDMMYASDKKGTHAHPQHLFNGFCKTIEDCHLIELDLAGGRFTWEKSRGSSNWISERLDRAFASEAWWTLFPLCNLTVHHTTRSDHDPIKLDLLSTSHSKKQFHISVRECLP